MFHIKILPQLHFNDSQLFRSSKALSSTVPHNTQEFFKSKHNVLLKFFVTNDYRNLESYVILIRVIIQPYEYDKLFNQNIMTNFDLKYNIYNKK